MLTGENGILTQAQKAKEDTENAQATEEDRLDEYENFINSATGTNTEFTDSLGNKVIVPAGFEVVNPENNVEDGIIIEDVTNGATKGSQFVWIPVGEIQTTKGYITINLDRYTFESDGTEIAQGDKEIPELVIGNYCKELSSKEYGNSIAKNINKFLIRTRQNGGYYIGRYEARTSTQRTSSEDILSQITINPEEYIYNNVTQTQATNLSRNMYNNSNFTSDLVNSYAWDTAILFMQKCSGDTDYSQQQSINTGYLAERGTKGTQTEDVKCNIYDMASNCFEWSTETHLEEDTPCIFRGGGFSTGKGNLLASGRYANYITESNRSFSFRPILYL